MNAEPTQHDLDTLHRLDFFEYPTQLTSYPGDTTTVSKEVFLRVWRAKFICATPTPPGAPPY